MMHATWYFDFVSPFAYLQWQRIRVLSNRVAFDLRPVLLAGLLHHNDHKGPAEIPSKRVFTYRFVQWRARAQGAALKFPPAHPFNPLTALRLCIAAGSSAGAVDAIFNHLWRDGFRGDDPESLSEVAGRLSVADISRAVSAVEVKSELLANFEAAIKDEVFGVPTIVAEDNLFWGDDATAMFEDYLKEPEMFATADMAQFESFPVGRHRLESK